MATIEVLSRSLGLLASKSYIPVFCTVLYVGSTWNLKCDAKIIVERLSKMARAICASFSLLQEDELSENLNLNSV